MRYFVDKISTTFFKVEISKAIERVELPERQKLCLLWLLPELLIRPIYRAFTLVADIDEIKEKFDKEYRDLPDQFEDRKEWLKEVTFISSSTLQF